MSKIDAVDKAIEALQSCGIELEGNDICLNGKAFQHFDETLVGQSIQDLTAYKDDLRESLDKKKVIQPSIKQTQCRTTRVFNDGFNQAIQDVIKLIYGESDD